MISSHLSLSRLLVSSGLSRGLEKCGQNRNLFESREENIHRGKFRGSNERGIWVFLFNNPNNDIRIWDPFVTKIDHGNFPFRVHLQEPKIATRKQNFQFQNEKKKLPLGQKRKYFFLQIYHLGLSLTLIKCFL